MIVDPYRAVASSLVLMPLFGNSEINNHVHCLAIDHSHTAGSSLFVPLKIAYFLHVLLLYCLLSSFFLTV